MVLPWKYGSARAENAVSTATAPKTMHRIIVISRMRHVRTGRLLDRGRCVDADVPVDRLGQGCPLRRLAAGRAHAIAGGKHAGQGFAGGMVLEGLQQQAADLD